MSNIVEHKVWLEIWMQSVDKISTKKINMTTYFENLTIGLHVFYVCCMSNFVSIKHYLLFDL